MAYQVIADIFVFYDFWDETEHKLHASNMLQLYILKRKVKISADNMYHFFFFISHRNEM